MTPPGRDRALAWTTMEAAVSLRASAVLALPLSIGPTRESWAGAAGAAGAVTDTTVGALPTLASITPSTRATAPSVTTMRTAYLAREYDRHNVNAEKGREGVTPYVLASGLEGGPLSSRTRAVPGRRRARHAQM